MQPSNPWLSVILPVHCGGAWLVEALDSLVAQTVEGIECIVIDSSPDDQTRTLIMPYAKKLHIEMHVRRDLDHWRSKTNFGFSVARAPYVSMLHQDDIWLSTRSQHLRSWLKAMPGAVMHMHPSYIVNALGHSLGVWRCPLPSDGIAVPATMMLERLLVQNFISVPAPIIRRDAYMQVGGLDETLWYTGDWDLYLKLARLGPVFYHAEPLSCFRVHGQSLTVTGSKSVDEFDAQMRQVLASHMHALPLERLRSVLPRAIASIEINTALAAASNGDTAALLKAFGALMRLGPTDTMRYMRDSRLAERVVPRLRARLTRML